MSRTQEQIDMMTKWAVRGIVAVCSFLIASLITEIRADIRQLLDNQHQIKEIQSAMDERIKTVERTLDKMN